MPPDIAIVVTSYERPRSLQLALYSIWRQSALERVAEVVVADDGSRDSTREVVAEFAAKSGMPLTFVTHPHEGFQAGRVRNEAALVSRAPYLLFIDGDCVLDRHCVATHAARRRPGLVLCGESYRLLRNASKAIDERVIETERLMEFVGAEQRRRIAIKSRRDYLYGLLRVPMRPRLTGNHFSMWREDFVAADGFDLGFRGWGLEDHDLQRRLIKRGVRCGTVLDKTAGFHLWHPPVESFVRNARGTENEAYYKLPIRPDGRAHQGLSSMTADSFEVARHRGGPLAEQPAPQRAA